MGIVVYPPSNAIEVFEWLEANYLACARPADRLASRGVGQRLTAVGAPPIARRGPKGEALYSGKALDAWAASRPRRRKPGARTRLKPRLAS